MIRRRWQSPDIQRKVRLAKVIEDACDQMPPDGDEELEADGLGWCANVDWGGMAAGIEDGVETDFNLATQPETFIKLISKKPNASTKAFGIIERQDKLMLEDWPEWDVELQLMLRHRRSLGLGIFHYPHAFGWHFRALHPCNLVLPPRSKLNTETWPWFAVRTDINITDLLERFSDRKAANAMGWQLVNITKAIVKYAQNGGSAMVSRLFADPEGYIYDLQHNDLAFASENNMTIPGWTFYVKEFDGSVSEYILTDDDEVGWLYKGERRHKSMSKLLNLFPLALGQGYIERIRGYGVKMLPFHDLENRVLNHACDVTMIGAGMLLKGSGADFKRMREDVHIHGPFTLISDDIEVEQRSFGNPSAGVLALRREFERLGHMRNRSFGGAEYSQRESDESATSARLRWQDRSTVRSYEVARFYRQLSIFHATRWQKMVDPDMTERDPGGKEYKEFIAELTVRGVTPDDISNIGKVRAKTIFGDGDPNNQFLALNDLKDGVGRLPASGQRVWWKMLFRARLKDDDLVEEMFGPDDPTRDREFLRQQWRCEVENNTFETSDTKQDLQDDDNHLIHAMLHTVYAEDVIGRVQEGHITEQDAIAKIMRCKPHNMQHLNLLQLDATAVVEFKDLMRRWADIDNTLRQMSQHVEAEMAKQQAQQLEELRNPKPSVKDQETILTEQMKRDAIAAESQLKMDLMNQRHAKEMEMLSRSGNVKDTMAMLAAARDTSQPGE